MIRKAEKETQQFKHSAADSELLLHQLPTRLVPRTPRYSNHTPDPQEKQKMRTLPERNGGNPKRTSKGKISLKKKKQNWNVCTQRLYTILK